MIDNCKVIINSNTKSREEQGGSLTTVSGKETIGDGCSSTIMNKRKDSGYELQTTFHSSPVCTAVHCTN